MSQAATPGARQAPGVALRHTKEGVDYSPYR